ncbi:MAG: hypothetical protein ACLFQJ_08305 [Campylobacterales bacterium]
MRKIFFAIAAFLMLSGLAHAKQVATCMAYVVGATSEMKCSGNFTGKATMVDLYKKGWRYVGHIGGASQFILVFEK